jgi:hypothetical protein
MPTIAVDTKRYSALVKKEFWPEAGWGKEVAATTLPFGTVAKFATGTWSALAAAPGADDKLGVVLLATEEDGTKKQIMVKGPAIVGKAELVLWSGVTDPDKAAVYAALEAVGIQVNDQI